MLYEKWQDNEGRRETVWQPTKQFLEDFAKTRPKQVNCWFGDEFGFPGQSCSCKRRNVFIANHRKEVAYLCTVFNNKAFFYRARNSKGKPFSRLVLKPVRDPVYYIMASASEDIGQAEIIRSIGQYLQSYPKESKIPRMADATICLFSEQKGAQMDEFIRNQAKRLAQKQ